MMLPLKNVATAALLALALASLVSPAEATKKKTLDQVVAMCDLDANGIFSTCLDEECHRVPTESCLKHCQRLSVNRWDNCMRANVIDTSGFNARPPKFELPKSMRPLKKNQ